MIALLRECRRLLKEGGLISATFIISGRVGSGMNHTKTYFGNRDRIEYNEDFLRGILEAEQIRVTEAPPLVRDPRAHTHFVLYFH
jgi:hypothetical protein